MEISVKTKGLKGLIGELKRDRAALRDLKPLWRDVGEYMVKSTVKRFDSEQAPDGTPWKPLSAARIAQRRKRHAKGKNKKRAGQMKILNDTGRQRRSVRYLATKDRAVVGTRLKYAATHQFGDAGRNIPARPFLGVTEADLAAVRRMMRKHVERK